MLLDRRDVHTQMILTVKRGNVLIIKDIVKKRPFNKTPFKYKMPDKWQSKEKPTFLLAALFQKFQPVL